MGFQLGMQYLVHRFQTNWFSFGPIEVGFISMRKCMDGDTYKTDTLVETHYLHEFSFVINLENLSQWSEQLQVPHLVIFPCTYFKEARIEFARVNN